MPIYEYACKKCGEEFEVEQRITEEALKKHSEAGAACDGEVKRLISTTSFALKGSGWYSDHYGLKPKGSQGKGGESKASGGAEKPSSGGESKAASS
ncbi:MAG: zinc ribbon domain-containing protein [Deltaproteobacteria bacterium]|nr:MAG: zinc ribbon domain-containing protein [Deltaproteobacteria bacterium]